MTDKNTMKEELRAYIVAEFLPGESPANVKDDTALRTSGVLDSMGLLKLVSHVEEQYGIELEAHETGIDNFDTIDAISNLIEQKISERA
ncbi:MAG TPA: acyl carrier protein [Terracidiphilus sp.]